ncbi:MAG: hypothetical protein A3I05_05030 [Deltaproteobacteria bacterium RIFCSPLOWO2_02_FULL_44_10]|nr:MAG: hypothetical protein A3I05_05030 [Deltaproteobacteria bacterium RIFCSPLOWO2_02_FULL_44_10]
MGEQIYTVIGSGPSAVHAALTLLERGKRVRLLDVGEEEKPIPYPEVNFLELKSKLSDPFRFFLGEHAEGVLSPNREEIFSYPPVRNFHVSSHNPYFRVEGKEFVPIVSHNRGGLGVAWGANCLPYDADDMRDFPVSSQEFASAYERVGKRIAICGERQEEGGSFLPLNRHDAQVWKKYLEHQHLLQKKFRIVMERARMAVDTDPHSPTRCISCNRCLWGCGVGAIYNPTATLELCRRYEQFEYRSGIYVTSFGIEHGKVTKIHFFDIPRQQFDTLSAETVLLGAGALSSAGIFLRTLKNDPQFAPQWKERQLRTRSVMDTQVIKLPYLLWRALGSQVDPHDFQFNKLILGYMNETCSHYPRYVHAEVLSLSSLLYHPLIESLPFGSRDSARIFAQIRSALGVATYFLPDRPYGENGISLEPDGGTITGDRLKITYQTDPQKMALAEEACQYTRRVFRRLGCWMPKKKMLQPKPGSGIHYAGTIPMSKERDILCIDSKGASFAYPNLYVIDGSGFPTLPSKSITFSLMANATRIAEHVS